MPIRVVILSALVARPPGDAQMSDALEALLDLWCAEWGDPVDGTILTVLRGCREEHDAAHDVPHDAMVLAPPSGPTEAVGLVATDDPAAVRDPRAWCELERGDGWSG
ncbi:hypothetical protein [Nocardioides alkalitolerans]|uniref:hypothetical protein n=1 Tax=Nocardioides alkalitolerans TaxID=281714 RepID=UPI00048EA259|nr:hypothetical protein [Nocardioides alkalitolerans]